MRPFRSLIAAARGILPDALCSSETDRSEIVAPVPRRHHILQTESRHWLGTPPLSPYSPPVSPFSATATSPARSRKRISQTLSLNNLSGHDPRRASSAAHPPSLHPYKEHKSEDDRSMARRWLRWMHQENMKAWIVPSLVLASIWVKWAVGLGSYSGLQSTRLLQCHFVYWMHRARNTAYVWRL